MWGMCFVPVLGPPAGKLKSPSHMEPYELHDPSTAAHIHEMEHTLAELHAWRKRDPRKTGHVVQSRHWQTAHVHMLCRGEP